MKEKLKLFSKKLHIKVFLVPAIVLVASFSVITLVRAHGGDSSLIHTCIGDNNGRTDIVGVEETCQTGETALDWVRNVFAGTGLTESRNSSGVTLSADTTYLQRRVSSTCAAGSSIRVINSDGTVECETITQDGWTNANEIWTYASSTSFTVSGDQTAKYRTGAKIKLTQTSVKYFYVVSSSHSGGTTTVTITGGSDYSLANASITSPYISYQATPQGFPDWFNWSANPIWDGTAPSSPTQSISRFSVIGRTVFIRFKYEYTTAGSNNTALFFFVPIKANGQVSEYNTPGSGYMSTGIAGSRPTISAHTAMQYGTNGEVYLFIDSGAAIRSVWVSLFYEI